MQLVQNLQFQWILDLLCLPFQAYELRQTSGTSLFNCTSVRYIYSFPTALVSSLSLIRSQHWIDEPVVLGLILTRGKYYLCFIWHPLYIVSIENMVLFSKASQFLLECRHMSAKSFSFTRKYALAPSQAPNVTETLRMKPETCHMTIHCSINGVKG